MRTIRKSNMPRALLWIALTLCFSPLVAYSLNEDTPIEDHASPIEDPENRDEDHASPIEDPENRDEDHTSPTTEILNLGKVHPQIMEIQKCVNCHDDAHDGQLGTECQQCHSFPAPWKRSWKLFDHAARTGYTLAGAHAALECAACHKDKKYSRVDKDCAACHADVQRFYRGTSHFPQRVLSGDEITTTPSPMFSLVRCEDCHGNNASRVRLSQIQSQCARCHTSDYAALAAYWQGALYTETDALLSEIKSLQQRLQKATNVPTDLRISLRDAQQQLREIEKALNDLRRLGIHNLPLLHRNLSHTRHYLDKTTQLLTPR